MSLKTVNIAMFQWLYAIVVGLGYSLHIINVRYNVYINFIHKIELFWAMLCMLVHLHDF